MKRIIDTERIPIKLWMDDVEKGALDQARNLANFPYAIRHIPVMPDCHTGYGMPIGAVLATREVVVPNAVGVDIGCGMCALKTGIEGLETGTLKQILGKARNTIPVGFTWHEHPQQEAVMPPLEGELPVVRQEYHKASKQVGTLGGGNHFIEIQKGSDGMIWIMIHSGSRNLGFTVAGHYNKLAEALNDAQGNSRLKKQGLAFLRLGSEEAEMYLEEMEYCVAFALANRRLMMDRMVEAMQGVIGSFSYEKMINESHNYAAWEEHFGENLLIHRKGATRAFKGEPGMIPGSQGTASYIVRGSGNPESFMSCSHGAGRVMGRRQARRQLDLSTVVEALDKQGVIHAIRHKKDLDEAPDAYKDIHEVMENQKDLAEVVVELSPLAVIKG